jgi:restriction system protein
MARSRSSHQEYQRTLAAAAREAERLRKAAERDRLTAEKEGKRRHLEGRARAAEASNALLESEVQKLRGLLVHGLKRSAKINLSSLMREHRSPMLALGPLGKAEPAPDWDDFAPRLPGALSRLTGGIGRYESRKNTAAQRFALAKERHQEQERDRQRQVAELQRQHAAKTSAMQIEVDRHNRSITSLAASINQREKDAVETYLSQALARTPLPKPFPKAAKVTFNPRTEQVVVQVELPPKSVVPATASYRFLPTKDEIRGAPRPAREAAGLYRGIISQLALLYIRDLFDSDQKLQVVAFNGHVWATNPATGEKEYPCLVSLNVERSSFPPDANLRKVEPAACMRHLRAIVSAHPFELEPIEPILDFDLSKSSFVDGLDAVSTLDSRPDLMEMSYTNFEHLVRQVFEAQGAEGWTTEPSHDDGVDAVILRKTPLMGGLCIVQAKRWSKVVGVSHVRELAGAMEEKKAGWGVLVTTSWFTQGCRQKAREHGRMELIDGDNLTYLVKKHLGKDVLIGIENRPRPKGSSTSEPMPPAS